MRIDAKTLQLFIIRNHYYMIKKIRMHAKLSFPYSHWQFVSSYLIELINFSNVKVHKMKLIYIIFIWVLLTNLSWHISFHMVSYCAMHWYWLYDMLLCFDVVQVNEEEPRVMWLSGLHIPESYLTALVQATCRKNGWPLDKSTLYTTVTNYINPDDVTERAHQGMYSH